MKQIPDFVSGNRSRIAKYKTRVSQCSVYIIPSLRLFVPPTGLRQHHNICPHVSRRGQFRRDTPPGVQYVKDSEW